MQVTTYKRLSMFMVYGFIEDILQELLYLNTPIEMSNPTKHSKVSSFVIKQLEITLKGLKDIDYHSQYISNKLNDFEFRVLKYLVAKSIGKEPPFEPRPKVIEMIIFSASKSLLNLRDFFGVWFEMTLRLANHFIEGLDCQMFRIDWQDFRVSVESQLEVACRSFETEYWQAKYCMRIGSKSPLMSRTYPLKGPSVYLLEEDVRQPRESITMHHPYSLVLEEHYIAAIPIMLKALMAEIEIKTCFEKGLQPVITGLDLRAILVCCGPRDVDYYVGRFNLSPEQTALLKSLVEEDRLNICRIACSIMGNNRNKDGREKREILVTRVDIEKATKS